MIGFRVDANEYIATGHLMRCMAIAGELIRRGEPCIFFLAEKKHTQRLEQAEIPYVVLDSCWNHLEGELPALTEKLQQYELRWLVVDTYQANASYLEKLNHIVPVLYIDDMNAEQYSVDAVLRYIDWQENDAYQRSYQGTATKVLAGMEYTPLRREFYRELPQNTMMNVPQKHINIFVTTGGTDPYNIAVNLVEYWADWIKSPERETDKRQEKHSFVFHVISGIFNESAKKLEDLSQQYNWLHCYQNISNMGEMMRQCDLAVSAGGTTLFELCACGIPTVCFSFADNQADFVQQMDAHKIMRSVGDVRNNRMIVPEIYREIFYYLSDPILMKKYSDQMNQLVDGKGVFRIADFLLGCM